jgi:hypothetical protein
MEESKSGVYSPQVIEFIAVADQFCKHLVRARNYTTTEFLANMQRLLPFLYLKAVNLPRPEPVFEEGNERFVREEEWISIDSSIATLLGSSNSFEEPYDQYLHETGEPVAGAISEYMADIYQDIKDFLLQYQTGTEEVMNDAVWECVMNFETVWGKKLLSVMRAIHRIVYSGTGTDSAEISGSMDEPEAERDTSSWIISKRQREFGEE